MPALRPVQPGVALPCGCASPGMDGATEAGGGISVISARIRGSTCSRSRWLMPPAHSTSCTAGPSGRVAMSAPGRCPVTASTPDQDMHVALVVSHRSRSRRGVLLSSLVNGRNRQRLASGWTSPRPVRLARPAGNRRSARRPPGSVRFSWSLPTCGQRQWHRHKSSGFHPFIDCPYMGRSPPPHVWCCCLALTTSPTQPAPGITSLRRSQPRRGPNGPVHHGSGSGWNCQFGRAIPSTSDVPISIRMHGGTSSTCPQCVHQ